MPTRTPSNARFEALCAANEALPSPPSDAGVGADPFLSRIEDEARRNAVAALDLADRVQREGDIEQAERLLALARSCLSLARRSRGISRAVE